MDILKEAELVISNYINSVEEQEGKACKGALGKKSGGVLKLAFGALALLAVLNGLFLLIL